MQDYYKAKINDLISLGEKALITHPEEKIVTNLFNIDLQKVLLAKGLPDFVKKVAFGLTLREYFTVGYYFSTMTNMEIQMLHHVVTAVETKDRTSVIFTEAEQQQLYKDFMLMGMLLALASGKSILNPEEVIVMKTGLENFILTEHICRFKKTHAALRHNYDLFEHDRTIAIAIKGGKDDNSSSKANA